MASPYQGHLEKLGVFNTGGAPGGDIVVFRSPADGTRLVKRVIGLPGDRVVISLDILNGYQLRWKRSFTRLP